MAHVSIIAIGDELVKGKLVDTNSSYIAGRLGSIGVREVSIRQCADSLESIVRAIDQEKNWADYIITTGGLGPTSDDGTRHAIAAAAQTELELDQASLQRLEEYSAKRNRPLNDNNRRQVYFPVGSEIVLNPIGTANAFITQIPRTAASPVALMSLPGVPREAILLCDEELLPRLEKQLSDLTPSVIRAIRCFGLPESHIGETVEACALPANVEVAYRPQFPEILLHLCTPRTVSAADVLEVATTTVRKALGDEFVISDSEELNMPQVVGELLRMNNLSLAAAESCSGGLLAHELVSIPGSSQFFRGSIVSYSNECKQEFLGVRADTLAAHGAVSQEVALEMVEGVRARTKADIAVSITGIAGPDGGSDEKPVGLVWFGLSSKNKSDTFQLQLPWGRDFVRRYSVSYALDLVRRHILGINQSTN